MNPPLDFPRWWQFIAWVVVGLGTGLWLLVTIVGYLNTFYRGGGNDHR